MRRGGSSASRRWRSLRLSGFVVAIPYRVHSRFSHPWSAESVQGITGRVSARNWVRSRLHDGVRTVLFSLRTRSRLDLDRISFGDSHLALTSRLRPLAYRALLSTRRETTSEPCDDTLLRVAAQDGLAGPGTRRLHRAARVRALGRRLDPRGLLSPQATRAADTRASVGSASAPHVHRRGAPPAAVIQPRVLEHPSSFSSLRSSTPSGAQPGRGHPARRPLRNAPVPPSSSSSRTALLDPDDVRPRRLAGARPSCGNEPGS